MRNGCRGMRSSGASTSCRSLRPRLHQRTEEASPADRRPRPRLAAVASIDRSSITAVPSSSGCASGASGWTHSRPCAAERELRRSTATRPPSDGRPSRYRGRSRAASVRPIARRRRSLARLVYGDRDSLRAPAGSPRTVRSGPNRSPPHVFSRKRPTFVIVEEMQKKRLGNSDLDLTPIGVGAWAMGGGGWAFAWGPQDDDESIAAIHEALDRGVNWIDTAAVYGLGHSEEVVARALEGRANRPYVFTKCERIWDEKRQIFKSLKARFRPPRVRGQPAPPEGRHHRPLPDPLARARRGHRGGLGHAGQAEGGGQGPLDRRLQLQRGADGARAARSRRSPRCSRRIPRSRRKSRSEILPYCRQHNIGVIVYSPMKSGLLTGKMTKERVAALPAGRLPQARARVSGAAAQPQPGARRPDATHRRAARPHRGRGRDRVDAAASRRSPPRSSACARPSRLAACSARWSSASATKRWPRSTRSARELTAGIDHAHYRGCRSPRRCLRGDRIPRALRRRVGRGSPPGARPGGDPGAQLPPQFDRPQPQDAPDQNAGRDHLRHHRIPSFRSWSAAPRTPRSSGITSSSP